MLNNTSKFLCSSWKEAGNITECNNWNLESIAESNEACCLHWCINVKTSSQYLGLVCNNTNRFTFDFDESSQNILGEGGHNLVEFIPVSYSLNTNLHIIWLIWVVWNNIIKYFGWRLILSITPCPRLMCSLLAWILGEEAQKLSCTGNGLDIVLEDTMRHTRYLTVHLSTTEFFFCYILISYCFNNIRASNKHIASILNHEYEVSQCWRINCTACTGAHDEWNLRDHTRWVNISLENVSITSKWLDTLLNTSTTRVVETNKWSTNKRSFVHNLANLLCICCRETTTEYCKVLWESKYDFTINLALTSNDTITIKLLFIHIKIGASMRFQLVILNESANIE